MTSSIHEWQNYTLDDIAEKVDYGYTASATDLPVGPRFLRITDIQNRCVHWDTVPYCVCSKRDLQDSALSAGDIVFARTGATTGKSFLIDEIPEPSIFASYLIRLRLKSGYDPRLLAYFFQTEDYWAQIKQHSQGATLLGVNATKLRSVKVELPKDQHEQRRIANILDEADSLRRRRAEAIRLANELVPSVFYEMFGDTRTNPMNWPVEPVSYFTEAFEGGKNLHANGESAVGIRHRILKVSAVTWQEYDPMESKPLPPDYEPPANHYVRQGDLLFSRANTTELVGATAYVFATPKNMILPDKIWRFVWRKPVTVDPLYVWSLFQDSYIRFKIGQRATGTSGSMKNISMPKVMSLPVPVPPLKIQQQFSERVRVLRGVQEQQTESQCILDNLFHSLLQRAFRGEI